MRLCANSDKNVTWLANKLPPEAPLPLRSRETTTMTTPSRFAPPNIPASFFAIVLGLAGLGGAWRAAHQVWDLPAMVGEILMLVAALVWVIVMALYLAKWVFLREEAIGETRHAVQCCFIGLAGVATMLIALAALPYSRLAAELLYGVGAIWTLVFALWRTGHLWRGERDHATTTAVLYLPLGAGGFVTAAGAAALGYPDWGLLAFGAGLFSWLAIESVLLHRLYTAPTMPPALRPTLGIQLAPPAVGALAYLSVSTGAPDVFVHAMLGYGLLQALMLLRLIPWIAEQPFAPSYWAFSFGATALATAPLRMIARGEVGAVATLAPVVFVAANILVVILVVGTLRLAVQGRLLPKPAPVAR
jgi:tellurite resistance protein